MSNALAREKSPYLLQHADNPVDWLPWGEAAFARARTENKPIFLSIGYSTCHWCHVMAHESFENDAIAAILNEHFIPVKVDREERPDVDKVYMAYVQAMTGHGGWPLSAWLTPDLKPFYGGTYYPPEDRHGRPGFPSLLQAIAKGWKTDPAKLINEADRVLAALREHHAGNRGGRPESENPLPADISLLEAASNALSKGFEYFYEAFDVANGGFGGAPKFPRASNLTFLFRVAALQGPTSEVGSEAIRLATSTLRAMARGGLHDHVGGGFHRYSVDESWFVPHFEKMLYDQAQIAMNCLEARQATGDERFAWMARDIFDYVLRDLRAPDGGFYTAEDADSPVPGGDGHEHAEGAFYVWTRAELAAAAGADADFLSRHFGVEESGNVPDRLDPQGELRGRNILVQRHGLTETARDCGLTVEAANDRLLAGLATLRRVRAQRPRPSLDDKILAANNGLMISAFARAHQIIERPELASGAGAESVYLAVAVRAAEFLQRELFDAGSGLLYRTWRGGRGTTEGFAEDYAFVIQGLLDLYEASFELRWLQWAVRLQEKMDELFADQDHGGYFNSAAGDTSILLRLKEDYDGAEPSPSSVAALNLLRLGAVLDAPKVGEGWRDRGRRCLEAFRSQWTHAPQAMPQMLCALELALDAPRHVLIAGRPESPEFRALAGVLTEKIGPRRVLLGLTDAASHAWLAERAPWTKDMTRPETGAVAYVCEEYTCRLPVSEPEALRRALA
jgi:uncharacterized protein YyaL (SSP411 family)